jgi:hypothetical protein
MTHGARNLEGSQLAAARVTQVVSIEWTVGSSPKAGLSRSEAIRASLLASAQRLRRGKDLAAEAAALEADEDDRAEMLSVATLMESLRAPR